ncbi:MAG: shikimate kinase [Atopobiaceae bacterium]|nr:shikimate kinase [Atopobiaceae bacterium]MCI2173128.1 shikimate kinase [Atopobiaceae bacterium]MCI2208221.1 shikimate kinase [Atopobiaceae bacterium]
MGEEAPYGLLGRRLSHSWSPQIHSLLGSAPYTLREVEPDALAATVADDGWRGLNVTIPYKRDVMALADEVSPTARRLGAANTLVRKDDGSILADNTDMYGFSWMLSSFCRKRLGGEPEELLGGRDVLVLGSGGASKAVIGALEDVGACPSVISRSGRDTYGNILELHASASLIVNTTPVGMFPDCPASPLDRTTLDNMDAVLGVLDVVYNPGRTGLMLDADDLSIPTAGGLEMLVAQARRSSELFQGHAIPDDVMDGIVDGIRREKTNVFLIGMPGCGKTGAGRRLARMTGRPFVDLDDVIEIEAGKSIPDIFSEEGEDAFRMRETSAVEEYGRRDGLIIACGGGVVTKQANLRPMRQNGTIIMLDRDITRLPTKGRPVSKERGVKAIAAERMPPYRSWADIILPCTGSAEGDAVKIKGLLHI